MCKNWSTEGSDELQQQYTGRDHPAQLGYSATVGKNGTVALALPQTPPQWCSALGTASKARDFKQSQLKTTQLLSICHCDWISQQNGKSPQILKAAKQDG